ncbi:aceE [Symbiodinium sp. KB8]|nr:aceE [Symbiodinium sp. KB8]
MLGSSVRGNSTRRVWRPVQADSETDVSTEFSPRIHDQDVGPRGPDGERGTCYAFAVATAIRSAQMRILGRAVEKHLALVDEITREFGCDGADVSAVLDALCPRKKLHHMPISRDEAAQERQAPGEGHAVVIVGASEQDWFIKNSWGDAFAHEGYFHVRKNAIAFEFHDVFFYTSDLTRNETAAYSQAPAVLEICIKEPRRSPRNPISSLGWEIDFETLRIERVRKRNCSIAYWNRENPFKKVMPGYLISSVNGSEKVEDMICDLQHADQLEIILVVAAAAKIPDICEKHARCYSCAHGVAAAICHAQSRIFGRPVEQHGKLASELIDLWGCESADVRGILNDACGSRGLHYEELDLVETGDIAPHRHVLASFELDEPAWEVLELCLRYSTEASTVPLRACDIQSDRTATQQQAAFFICGQGYSSDFDMEFWYVMDLLGRRMKVEKHALHLRYYDVFFYISDLSQAEISLFNSAARILDVEIRRAVTWIKGVEPLGWTVDSKTLQVEWTASWGPIGDYNSAESLDQQVHPGHVIQSVNGTVRPECVWAPETWRHGQHCEPETSMQMPEKVDTSALVSVRLAQKTSACRS